MNFFEFSSFYDDLDLVFLPLTNPSSRISLFPGVVTLHCLCSEQGILLFLQDILAGCKGTLSLSPQSGTILERLSSFSPQKSFLVSKDCCSNLSETPTSLSSLTVDHNVKNSRCSVAPFEQILQNPVRHLQYKHFIMNFNNDVTFRFVFTWLQTCGVEVKHESPGPDFSQDSGPVSSPAISLLSPKAMEMAGQILRFQEEQRERAKVRSSVF